MPKKTSYFSHDSNARNDEKILAVRMRHNAEGYGIYFMIIERLRDESDYMSVKDYNVVAFDLRVDASKVKSVVEDFGLFVFTEDGKYFYSESLLSRMEMKDESSKKRSEAGKKGMEKRWNNKNDNNVIVSDSNVITNDKIPITSKVKESKEKKEPPLNSPKGENDSEYFLTRRKRKLTGKRLETFNSFWEKFDYKKGKAEAADAWMDIPELTIALCEKINLAAEIESKRRPDIELSGKIPKMAQGWITARRWEDEIYWKKESNQPEKKQIQRCER